MKEITVSYKFSDNAYTTNENWLARYLTHVITEANAMLKTSAGLELDCPIKQISDVRWDIQRILNKIKNDGGYEKFDFRIEVKPDRIQLIRNGNELFAEVLDKEIAEQEEKEHLQKQLNQN